VDDPDEDQNDRDEAETKGDEARIDPEREHGSQGPRRNIGEHRDADREQEDVAEGKGLPCVVAD
jgi:hypothetical protein